MLATLVQEAEEGDDARSSQSSEGYVTHQIPMTDVKGSSSGGDDKEEEREEILDTQ